MGLKRFSCAHFRIGGIEKGIVNVKKDQRECLRMHISLHISQAVLNLLLATKRPQGIVRTFRLEITSFIY